MEITHKLIHVRKELCERDRLDEPDGAECCELAPGDGCGRGPRRCLRLDVSVVKEGACLVERVIGTGGRHGEEGGEMARAGKRVGASPLRFYGRMSCRVETIYVGSSNRIGALPYSDDSAMVHDISRSGHVTAKHGQTRARRRGCCRDCLAQSKLSAPGSEHAFLYYHVDVA